MAADPSPPTPTDRAEGQSSGRGGRLTLWGVAIVALAVSVFGGHQTSDVRSQVTRAAGPRISATATATPSTPSAPSDTSEQQTGPELPRSEPTRLIIPKIGVDAPFTTLTIGATGQLQPPPADDTNLVGWYSKGASPGEKGTAIIAGHVDTTTSAAVFANLDDLRAGDHFTVQRADGRPAEFVVDDTETFAKDEFPSKRVYDDAERPEVRLITCAGAYDHTVRDYTDNLVVFAHLV